MSNEKYCPALQNRRSTKSYEYDKAQSNFTCQITGQECVGHVIEDEDARGGSDSVYYAQIDSEIMNRCPLRYSSMSTIKEITSLLRKAEHRERLKDLKEELSELERELTS